MSDSNHPTLPPTPPPAANTVLDLRGVIIDAVREVFATEVTPHLERLEIRMAQLETKVDRTETTLADVRKDVRMLGRKMDVLNRTFLEIRAEQVDLDDRVTVLEAKPT